MFSRLVAQTATSLSLWVVVVAGGDAVVLVISAASGLESRRGASFPAFARHFYVPPHDCIRPVAVRLCVSRGNGAVGVCSTAGGVRRVAFPSQVSAPRQRQLSAEARGA